MRGWSALRHCRSGATAAEFALVLPVALLFLLGIIDVGNYAFRLNQYEKATQMGARFAVVTDLVASGLKDEDYVGNTACGGTLAPGDRICAEALSPVTCTETTCSCSGNCPADLTADGTAFDNIVARMQTFAPGLDKGKIRVVYTGSDIGFAGDPTKPEIAPVVTVRLQGATYSPIVLSPFNGTVSLPSFSYSLTLEDGEGTKSS